MLDAPRHVARGRGVASREARVVRSARYNRRAMGSGLPVGTVAFLFTDIEGRAMSFEQAITYAREVSGSR
jgi:hypothetical protein